MKIIIIFNRRIFIKLKQNIASSKIIYLNISLENIYKYFQKKIYKEPDFLFITNIDEYIGNDTINIYMNKIIYANRNDLYIANRYNVFKIKSFINKINKFNSEKIDNFFNIEHKGWNNKFNSISMYNFINLITPIIYKKQINYKNKKKFKNENYIFLDIKKLNINVQNNIFNHINVSTKPEIFLKYRNIKDVLKIKDIIIDGNYKVLDGFHALNELILRGYTLLPFKIKQIYSHETIN